MITETKILTDQQISDWMKTVGSYNISGYTLNGSHQFNEFARAIEQAVLQSPEVVARQWQPIETAPKDGTWVMAYRPPCEGIQMDTIVIVSWQDFEDEGSAWMWPDEPYDPTTEAGKAAALSLIASGNLYWDEEFTHWMPLPAPPTDTRPGQA